MSEGSSPWVSRAVVLVLVVLGVVAGLFTFLRERDPGDGQFHPDNSFAAVTRAGKLELRGEDGKLLKLLREDLYIHRDGVRISITPDGRYGYHDAARTRCKGTFLRAVARVDLVRGVTELAAVGESPTVSADGRKLAYLTPSSDGDEPVATLAGERPVCGDVSAGSRGQLLVVRDLGSRSEERWAARERLTEPRWLADNRQVSVARGAQRIELDTTQVGADLGDIEPRGRERTYVPKQFVSREETLAADCTVDDEEAVASPLRGASGPACRFAVLDPAGSAPPRTIATLRGLGDGLHVAELHHRSGRLMAGWSTGDRDVLLSYVPGDRRATLLAEAVATAAWLPNPR